MPLKDYLESIGYNMHPRKSSFKSGFLNHKYFYIYTFIYKKYHRHIIDIFENEFNLAFLVC